MGNNRKPGNKNIIKSNLKTSDRISLIYNDEEVEMSLVDFNTYLNSSDNKGYAVYSALLTQSGIGAPTTKILENTLGGTPTFGYTSDGTYTITLTGAFTADKTFILMGNVDPFTVVSAVRTDADTLTIKTYNTGAGSLANAKMTDTPIEIRVYN
jgi:hypothetical protein